MKPGDRVLLGAPLVLVGIAAAGALLVPTGNRWVIVGVGLLALVTGVSGMRVRTKDRHAAGSIRLQLDAHERWLTSKGVSGTRLVHIALDLAGFDLSDRDLSHADLEGVNLEQATLRNTKLNHASLRHADLESVDATGASFHQANLVNANLAHANLRLADFSSSRLESAALLDANLEQATLANAMMRSARLSNANVTGTDFSGVDLTDARLVGCIVTGANFTDTRLVGADLREVELTTVGQLNSDLDEALIDAGSLERAQPGTSALLPSPEPRGAKAKQQISPSVKLAMANDRAKSGRNRDALDLYEEVIATDDDRIANLARIGLVEMFIQSRDLEGASSWLKRTSGQSPSEPAFTLFDVASTKDHLRKSIQGGSVPAAYLYSGLAGGQGWIRLCHDPRNVAYRNAVAFWTGSQGDEIADLVREHMVGAPFDYVSFGCGDGRKDAEIVKRWLPTVDRVAYFPFDISYFLLSSAVNLVREAGEAVKRRLRINAVLNDFSNLSVMDSLGKESERTVYGVLGRSLGSVNEVAFLQRMRRRMAETDLLVVEVPVAFSGQAGNEMISDAEADFYSAPLKELDLPYDLTNLRLGVENNVSSIKNTITFTISYTEESVGSLRLAAFHYYSATEMVDALEVAGFSTLKVCEDIRRGVLACVVRPA